MNDIIMNSIGLKYFFKKYKGTKIKYKLSRLKYELCYAWKRAWLGYDDIDVFDCNERFRQRMLLVLQDFRKHHLGLLNVPKQSEHYEQLGSSDNPAWLRYFNEEDTDFIIDIMIWHLKMMDENFVEKLLFGSCVYDDEYEFCRTLEDHERISNIMEQNKECFMELFNLFYYDLWD